MNITEIENALYAWVYGQTGITTVFGLQPKAVRPSELYAVINVFTTSALGTKETVSTLLPDGSTDNVYSAQKEFTASINIFYDGAYEVAEALRNSLHKVSVADALWESGIGFHDATEVQRIPNVTDEAWEERGQFDISFHYRSEVTENVESIQNIGLTSEIDDYETIITLTPVPVLIGAVIPVTNTEIQLLFSDNVTFGAGGNSGWSLSSPSSAMSYASGEGSTILVYDLDTPVEDTDTPTVAYVQPGNGVESLEGEDLETLTGFPVENTATPVGLLFENDFTGDPLGPYDPVNSDYIDPSLTVESIIFGDARLGVITTDGYGPEPTWFSGINFLPSGDPTSVVAKFSFSDTSNCYIFHKEDIAANEGMGVFFQGTGSGVDIQAALYPGVMDDTIIVGAPATWINKEITCVTTLTGDSLEVSVTYEGLVIYTNTVTLPVEGNNQAALFIADDDCTVQYFSLT